MTEGEFLFRMKKAFLKNLPGVEAHRMLASSFRPLNRDEITDIESFREAAVAIICYPIKNSVNTLLIQRPKYDGHHGGQIALPGGKYETEDRYLEKTARRETKEEIGWTILKNNYLGQLTEMFIPESKFRIQPFVYFVKKPQQFILDIHEVEHVIEFPIDELNKDNIVKYTTIELRNGLKIPRVPYFAIDKYIVWGATAIILSEFRQMIY